MSTSPKGPSEYVLVSPEGRIIKVPAHVFNAFCDFIDKKHTGVIQINFLDGGMANTKCTWEKTFMNGKQAS